MMIAGLDWGAVAAGFFTTVIITLFIAAVAYLNRR